MKTVWTLIDPAGVEHIADSEELFHQILEQVRAIHGADCAIVIEARVEGQR